VRHLAELHGGTVQAENSTDGTGAVFTVRLPVMAVSRSMEHLAERAREVHAGMAGALSFDWPPDLKGTKILAVDDEADARGLLKALFEQCGAEVMTAGSAEEAMTMLEEHAPDVLVSDIGMPGEDGYSLIQRIRESNNASYRRIPAVALTAFARTEDRFRALQAGYNMHVPKPVEPAELALVISRLVS
jgi:CheY-like chemotaxis protein